MAGLGQGYNENRQRRVRRSGSDQSVQMASGDRAPHPRLGAGSNRSRLPQRGKNLAEMCYSPARKRAQLGSARLAPQAAVEVDRSHLVSVLSFQGSLRFDKHLSFASGIFLPPRRLIERFSRKHTYYGTIR